MANHDWIEILGIATLLFGRDLRPAFCDVDRTEFLLQNCHKANLCKFDVAGMAVSLCRCCAGHVFRCFALHSPILAISRAV
jgi:hypothetical protein